MYQKAGKTKIHFSTIIFCAITSFTVHRQHSNLGKHVSEYLGLSLYIMKWRKGSTEETKFPVFFI